VTADAPMAFMDHLVELRSRLIRSLIAVALATVVAAFFYNDILELLSRPYLEAVDGERLAFFQPTEAFSLALRLSLWGGVILASPVIIYQLWRFVGPALTARERRYVIPLSGVLGLLFAGGVVVGYLVMPLTLELLVSFGQDFLEPTIGADFYLRFAMRFLLAFGIAFEFPVFLFASAVMGITTSRRLREWRRYAVTIIVIGAALLTPGGDPLTLLLLSVPLYVLYEGTILAIRLFLKR
jgi:sec-independent protein translocase protein TatC